MDRAVEAAVLDAIQPAGVTAAVEALEQVVAEHDTTRQALPLALEKARDDKPLIDGGKHVGHLRRDDFTTLRDWCRAMRLGSDAAVVEAAVTAAPG